MDEMMFGRPTAVCASRNICAVPAAMATRSACVQLSLRGSDDLCQAYCSWPVAYMSAQFARSTWQPSIGDRVAFGPGSVALRQA